MEKVIFNRINDCLGIIYNLKNFYVGIKEMGLKYENRLELVR